LNLTGNEHNRAEDPPEKPELNLAETVGERGRRVRQDSAFGRRNQI
jgi:hypothetical protein